MNLKEVIWIYDNCLKESDELCYTNCPLNKKINEETICDLIFKLEDQILSIEDKQ